MKKYTPFIFLALAALLLFFVKRNQRGSNTKEHITTNTNAVNTDEGFNRNPENIIYTKHAKCRMECRHITEEEIIEILQTGKVVPNKIDETDRGKTYPLDGRTKGDKMMRVVVAPKRNDLVIITVIDLDTDWPCGDCKY